MQLHTNFSFFLDRPKVMAAVERKQRRVLAKTGGFTRTAMRRQIRPASKSKKSRTITHGGRVFLVQQSGLVLDAKTNRPIRTALAKTVRAEFYKRERVRRRGKPPQNRQGELRKHIYFAYDPQSESVVIAPLKFQSQPRGLVNVVSIPELLERGGAVRMGNVMAHFDPHPYASPVLPLGLQKLQELTESEPLR